MCCLRTYHTFLVLEFWSVSSYSIYICKYTCTVLSARLFRTVYIIYIFIQQYGVATEDPIVEAPKASANAFHL